ncbi:MBL fold metallo-hydrolase [Jannaschia ovalis]|uniref:MBL fold metallo-hydrolase n=1 Tax=Jannaschia ovalis TaxID=3038773 RepID=A0ABY8LEN0_9RHOB|nr:MBL fold metallo-hydrolase [Jannaschia sp. GRR-S6-38]WGH79621.1 MBL fold metallo-hydrolase [Jannaschia sp. GRR-S6-38]
MISRRHFLAAAAAGLALPRYAVARTTLPDGAVLTTVSDGSLVLPGDFIFAPMPEAELGPLLAELGVSRDRLTPECNLALLQRGDRTVLFDAGAGPDFMPTAGTLPDALDAAGIAPEAVTDVVFTHAHPDHLWGVLDDFGDPMFPEAAHHMGAAERDYWADPATVDTIGAARATFAVGAARRIDELGDRIQTFADGAEIVPGVEAVLSPGHTPGHMAFRTEGVLILGDAITNAHVALARPEWPSGSDQDQALAAETRLRLIDQVLADDLQIVGFHLPNGGMGRLERAGDGFRFLQS